MIRVLCLIGAPRTGSTRVASILSGFQALAVRREIFNDHVAESLEQECSALGAHAGITGVQGVNDRRLVDWLRSHPNDAIEWLLPRMNKSVFVFKLFDGHIRDPELRRQVLSRPDTGFLLVRRRPIDIYISAIKAWEIRRMRYVDTTNVQARGDVEEFIKGVKRLWNWFDECYRTITDARRPVGLLSYGDEIMRPDAEFVELLRHKLEALGVDPGAYGEIEGRPVTRQDRSTSYVHKMTNWATFSEALRRYPDYAQAFDEWAPGTG